MTLISGRKYCNNGPSTIILQSSAAEQCLIQLISLPEGIDHYDRLDFRHGRRAQNVWTRLEVVLAHTREPL